ncbi:DUF4255 domain-containing protein [bacterium SCSIO 12741]|nr:DUF4255 domain-containing protein [bacterium SCSIO 12741]
MIYDALNILRNELNQHIRLRLSTPSDRVMLSGVSSPEGQLPVEFNDKILLSLVNLEHETNRRVNANFVSGGAAMSGRQFPSIQLNLYVMCSAYFNPDNYDESLKFISEAISFFQGKPVFTSENTPDMPESINKITLEVVNLNMQDMSHFWGVVGARYLPSVIYKVRMLNFQDGKIVESLPNVQGTQGQAR